MNDFSRHRLLFLVITGLVILLPFLASLQYKWLGQLSSSELDRKQSSLQTSARQFGHALNNEIYPAQWAFRVSFTQSLDEVARQLRTGYASWSARTSRPELIESIYWVEYAPDRSIQLFTFDRGTGQLHATPWPANLEGWRTYFIERSRRQLEYYRPEYQYAAQHSASEDTFLSLGAELMVNRPAIIIPVSIDSEIASEDLLANLNATSSGRAGHTLITLNHEHLVGSFFPALSDTLIYSIEQDVDLMIVSSIDSTQAIYSSDPELDVSHFNTPDAKQNIGRFRWMPFTSASRLAFGYASLIERDGIIADSVVDQLNRSWPSTPADSFIESAAQVLTDYPAQAIIRLVQEEDYKGALTADHLMMALSRLRLQTESSSGSTSPTTEQSSSTAASPPSHAWTLLMRHKEGSVESVVQASQRKNLFLSFGILGILGVGIILIFTSAQRARNLADRQMNFVAGVSHELRTPLAVILSASQNLADGVVSEPKRLQKYGELISHEGRRLTDMIENMLELAGVQSGKKKYMREDIPVKKLIDEALNTWDKTIQQQNFTVEVNIEPDLPSIYGDPHALHTALSNLISNAIKYSNGQRSIEISAKCTQRFTRKEVTIEVTDKGKGIPKQEQSKIFEEFYRGAAATKAQIHGNGIGLSLVKKTMDAHQGSVSVSSESNEGTTFTLRFPI
ncbi:MAG: HAMP domain-containing histidine kinase [Rhodothermaceae bacterium]|nr:HAMP domain-containing histidine kinase [Rhodothermaceae bacterium]